MKLTQRQIDNIRQLWSGGESPKTIAKQYGLSDSMLSRIVHNKCYQDKYYNYESAKQRRQNAIAIANALNNISRDRDNLKAQASECEKQATFLDGVIANMSKSSFFNEEK